MSNIKTDKEAFDFVVLNLLHQGDKCVDLSDDCQYRGFIRSEIFEAFDNVETDDYDDLSNFLIKKHGGYTSKCAAGWLIDDKFYKDSFEGDAINDRIVSAIMKSHSDWKITDNSLEMIINLQNIHDRRNADSWANDFSDMEKMFDENGKYKVER